MTSGPLLPHDAHEPIPARRSAAPRQPLDLAPFTLDLTGQDDQLAWSQIFGNDHPVELEIGSGKGLFLQNAATAAPGHNFVGVELSRKYAKAATERVARKQLTNVRVWQGDARLFMARRVPTRSLRAAHVYFPDPWWKARHKKRRVFAAPLLADLSRAIEVGGELWIATDVEEYFGVMVALVATDPAFHAVAWPDPDEPAHELDYRTNFERKYRIEGRPIFRARYLLRP